MKYRIIPCLFLILCVPLKSFAQDMIDLSGLWEVELDTLSEEVFLQTGLSKTTGTINLPGSLAENGFGYKTTGSDYGILTPEYKYIGKAGYIKQIEIPTDWKHKQIEIFLERVLWESRVFMDGIELSKQDALGTPHVHKLGAIAPGKHELRILVDNAMIHNIGDKGHAYGEYTQSIWHGIVGRMELKAKDATSFLRTNIYPDIEKEQIDLKGSITSQIAVSCIIEYKVVSVDSDETVLTGSFLKELKQGENNYEIEIATEGKLEKWSEFNPEVYTLKLGL
ncbi:MAG: glycoside hydrolase family 2, partial [Bacteroidota bacterium]